MEAGRSFGGGGWCFFYNCIVFLLGVVLEVLTIVDGFDVHLCVMILFYPESSNGCDVGSGMRVDQFFRLSNCCEILCSKQEN